MNLSRRGLLGGLVAALAAPAIIRTPGLLMPVKRIMLPNEWVDVPFSGTGYSELGVIIRETARLIPLRSTASVICWRP
jgi:hypothetical protein